jgi:glycosyltransferase involved in cell wall biosynthesis
MEKRKILWVTRMAPADIDSAGLILQYRYLEILSKHYEIVVISQKEDYGTNPLKKLGITAYKYKSTSQLQDIIKQSNFDVAIISWWDLAETFLPIIRRFVERIIINTVDVEFVRKQRQNLLGIHSVYYAKRELAVYNKATKLWFVTEQDKNAVLEHINKPYSVIPIIQKPKSLTVLKERPINKNFIFIIGNYLHEPNVDAALTLCQEIFPLLHNKYPNLELFVFGKWAPKELLAFDSESIHVTGIVYDLEKRLDSMFCSIANLRWGAGLKGKVCESMSYGIPVIGTVIAFEGLDIKTVEPEINCLLAHKPEEYVEAFDKLQDDNLYNLVWENAHQSMQKLTNCEYLLLSSIEDMFK